VSSTIARGDVASARAGVFVKRSRDSVPSVRPQPLAGLPGEDLVAMWLPRRGLLPPPLGALLVGNAALRAERDRDRDRDAGVSIAIGWSGTGSASRAAAGGGDAGAGEPGHKRSRRSLSVASASAAALPSASMPSANAMSLPNTQMRWRWCAELAGVRSASRTSLTTPQEQTRLGHASQHIKENNTK
jgi:hypothetical protein